MLATPAVGSYQIVAGSVGTEIEIVRLIKVTNLNRRQLR